jgi:hypothetical protein
MSLQNIKKIRKILSLGYSPNVFTTIDEFFIIDLDKLTNREYQFEGAHEFLYLISKLGKDKILLFLIRDGVNPFLTGMTAIIDKTIEMLNLTKDTCYLFGYYENIGVENITLVYTDFAQIWARQIYPHIKNLPIASNQFNKRFAGLFGRHDMYRLKFCRYLHERYLDDSILSYNSNRGNWNHRFAQEFKDDQDWYIKNCPILLDFNVARSWVPYQDSLSTISKWYNEYFIEIVSETDPYSNRFFTEKTLKNFFLGKPFLLFSGKGSLEYLRKMGYETFSPWIDETYDSYSGFDRLQFIVKEIDRLATISLHDIQIIHQELTPIFNHNRLLSTHLKFNIPMIVDNIPPNITMN